MESTKNTIIGTLIAIFIVLVVALMAGGCIHGFEIDFDEPPIQGSQLEMCDDTLVPVLEPAFVTTWMEILEPVSTVSLLIGNLQPFTTPLDSTIGQKVDSLLEVWKPAYTYQTAVKNDDPKVFSTIIDGTNNHNEFLLKISLRYNVTGKRHYFGATIQGFLFAGSRTYEEYLQAAIDYPSVNRFNFRETDWTPEQYDKVDSTIIGCGKLGRQWADLHWGIHNDSIAARFPAVGWGLPSGLDGGIVDLSGMRANDELILYYLKKGHQVITD